jgi:hypothetical protein
MVTKSGDVQKDWGELVGWQLTPHTAILQHQ